MGLRFAREKPRHPLLSVAYKLNRLIPGSGERKLDFLLDLEWIANRLAHENSVRLGLLDRSNPFLADGIKPTDAVLDIGCKDGAMLAGITAARKVGIDLDQTALEEGRKHHPDIEFIRADARTFDSSGFDVVILSHILEHLEEPEGLLKAVTAKRVYVEVPDFEGVPSNLLRVKRNRKLIYSDADHVAEYDRAEAAELFSGCGFEIAASEFKRGVMRYWLRPA